MSAFKILFLVACIVPFITASCSICGAAAGNGGATAVVSYPATNAVATFTNVVTNSGSSLSWDANNQKISDTASGYVQIQFSGTINSTSCSPYSGAALCVRRVDLGVDLSNYCIVTSGGNQVISGSVSFYDHATSSAVYEVVANAGNQYLPCTGQGSNIILQVEQAVCGI